MSKRIETSQVQEDSYVSTTINTTRYNFNKNELTVEFKSGARYVYYGVTVHDYFNLAAADSVGSFFNENIKNVYKFDRLAD